MQHRFPDEFELVEFANGAEDVRGVGALTAPRLDELLLLEQCQHPIQEPLLGRPIQEPLPELREHAEVESGVFQLQAEGVFPVEPGADGVGGLAVGEVLGELHHRNEGEPPGCRGGLPRVRVEVGEVGVGEKGTELVAHGDVGVPLREGGSGDAGGHLRDGEVGLGVERHGKFRSGSEGHRPYHTLLAGGSPTTSFCLVPLLEISEDLLDLEHELEQINGDVDAAGELVNHWLAAAALEAEKLDHYAALITELELRAEARKAEAQRMAERARIDENRAAFLKERLKDHFVRHGRKSIETRRYRITHALNGGLLPVLLSVEPGALTDPRGGRAV